jgi:TRAP transporter TAXI family solute receptor
MFKTILYIMSLAIIANATDYITIGTGSITGVYYPTGGAICNMVNKQKFMTDVRCAKESTGGSVYNINAIRTNEIDFGIAQSDIAYQAYNGLGKFKKRANKELRVIMGIYPELLTLVVRRDSGIKSLKDIEGKRVNIGNHGSGQRSTVEQLFEMSKKLDINMLDKAYSMKASEAVNAIKSNKIDGYFYVVGHPTANIKEVATTTGIDIISIDNSSCATLKKLLKKYPYYSMGKIEANTYNGIKDDRSSFGVKALLLTSAQSSDRVVKIITKAILDNFEEFKSLHPAYKNITKTSLIQGLGIPQHKAAKKVFEDMDIK